MLLHFDKLNERAATGSMCGNIQTMTMTLTMTMTMTLTKTMTRSYSSSCHEVSSLESNQQINNSLITLTQTSNHI